MDHQESFTIQAGNCRYTQCSCGNARVTIGLHTLALGPSTLGDLRDVLERARRGKRGTVAKGPLPPSLPSAHFELKEEWTQPN
jgi:hypothetical protein